MVTYTSAFLAAANLLALVHAAPAQPVCSVVTTVITGKPIWVPRPDPTTAAGWSGWQGQGGSSSSSKKTTTTTSTVSIPTTWSNGGGFYTASTSTWSSSSIPVISITVTPTTWSSTYTTSTTDTPTTSSATPTPAPTCAASGISTFEADGVSGSCGCEFAVTCNMHAPYTADSKFWERTSGEIIGSLEECQAICNDNDQCTAAIWVNKDGAPSNEYMRCWQTANLPQPNEDGYGQLSYKGACSSSCQQSYSG